MEAKMKKLVIMAVALLVLPASAAFAGLDLAWQNCALGNTDPPNLAPTSVVTMNCAQAAGNTTRQLYLEFKVPTDFTQAAAFTAFLNFQSQRPGPLGGFWRNDAPCPATTFRNTSLFDAIPVSCADGGYGDVSGGGPDGTEGMTWLSDDPSPGRARIIGVVARGSGMPLTPGLNYYLANIAFTNRNRVATCNGGDPPATNACNDQAAIYWNKLIIESFDRPAVEVTGPSDKLLQCALFNGAGVSVCAATPVRNTTWGKIKAIYR
jgi:hypothetical protein